MKKRPRKLVWLACFLVLMAVSFPLQIMVLYEHGPWESGAIAAKLAPFNWLVIGLAPCTAWLAYRASPWLMVALPTLTASVFYNNWVVGQVGTDYSSSATALGSLAFLAVIAALVNRDALQVLFNPQSRWWLTPERKRLQLPVRLKFLSRPTAQRGAVPVREAFDEFRIRTFDLSESGVFIPLDQAGAMAGEEGTRALQAFGAILRNLDVGTQCYVCLPLRDVNFIQCRAEVVRNTPGRGVYPAGVGLRFLGLSWSERRKLNQFLEAAA